MSPSLRSNEETLERLYQRAEDLRAQYRAAEGAEKHRLLLQWSIAVVELGEAVQEFSGALPEDREATA